MSSSLLAAEGVSLARCSRHPGAKAGWYCRSCEAARCPGCVFVRGAPPVELACCSTCGEAVEALTIHRREARSYAARLPSAVVRTFTIGGLLTFLGGAVVMWFFAWFGLPGAILRLGVFWGLVFAAVRHAARGEPGFEPPDLSDLYLDVVRPALLGILAVSLVWVPALVWLTLRPGGRSAPALEDPVFWAIGVAGVLYAPMAVLHAAVGGSAGQMMNPVAIVGAAVRIGGDYLIAVGACVLVVVADGAWSLVDPGALGAIPFVSGVLREAVGLVPPIVLARALGLLLYVRGDVVGMGMPGEYLEPVLAGVAPRGSAPAPRAPVAPAPGAAARFEAIELDPPPPPPVDESARIVALVQAGDLAAAARAFAAWRDAPGALPPAVLFQVARGAAGAGEHLLAARALHAAAKTMDPAVAPDALLVLARICLQRLDRPADARSALAALLARFPESAAARHARELQAKLAAG